MKKSRGKTGGGVFGYLCFQNEGVGLLLTYIPRVLVSGLGPRPIKCI